MNCPKCNGRISLKNNQCPFCKMDLTIYHKIFKRSNYYYNDGLQKARVRDLSGAVVSLKKSLELNKSNTDARNLLGLVYFEMGETVAALSAWVISKHLQQENNEADRYIRIVQKSASRLEAMNQTIKKFNIALQSAKSGNLDLAILQLKKVTSMNPHFVKAQQLLALVYLQGGEKERAKSCLKKATQIDVANTLTLTYLAQLNSTDHSAPVQVEREAATPVEKDPNAAFMPVSSYKEEKPNVRAWINLVIGAAIGIACGYILLVPAARKSVHEKYKTESVSVSSKISVYTAQISSLENENEDLKKHAEQLQAQLDGIVIPEYDEAMYDDLFDALALYMEENEKPEEERDMKEVASLLLNVGDAALENKAASKLYKTLKEATFTDVALSLYEEGHNLYQAGKYEDALNTLLSSYDYNSKDPNTIYFIARTYHRMSNNDKAKKYYNKIIDDYQNSNRYSDSKLYLSQIKD